MQNLAAAVETPDRQPVSHDEAGRAGSSIRLSNISKYYAGVAALEGVDAEFTPGEVHAILGENGAGKSTLMNIISGALVPDSGTIMIDGRQVSPLSPESAAALGIAISFQHPAVLDDLTVLENLQVALPASVFAGRSDRAVAGDILSGVGLEVSLQARGDSLTIAQKHLLEIAKALAIEPRVLILDEPTASLDQDATAMLFGQIREVVARGTSVIYITHRLAELRQIAHRVTVLRDGRVAGQAMVADVDDDTLLSMIIGRQLGSTFPAKAAGSAGTINLCVERISGQGFTDVSFEARKGEILGVAGVAGNGQSDLMRALAGLRPYSGRLELQGERLDHRQLLDQAAFMPSDRHAEGLAGALTIRENAALSALPGFSRGGLLSHRREVDRVSSTFDSLAVKAPGMEAAVGSLSGGNQQKVVMARALLSEPGILVADEPTQGVDVGARAEIYRILREVSDAGTPVVVNSSDAAELEGLCDRVIVMSRGRVVDTLTGDAVVESRIVGAAVGAETHADDGASAKAAPGRAGWLKRFIDSDNAPVIPLAGVIVALALFVFSQNAYYLSAYNITNILLLATALGFIALGQTVALLLAGIDLSVGPLAGLLVVVASFFVNEGQPVLMMATGFVLIVLLAILVGAFNGGLIRFAHFTPIAATLAMYIGLQGCSFLLRDGPGGYIDPSVIAAISAQIGPIPVAFIVLCAVALGAEYALRRVRGGWRLRATGSNEESARRLGIPIDRTFVAGYVAVALFTAGGAVMLMAQIGVGDPQQGVNYTLSSITAVVLGGTSLRGGRGSFVTTLLGALLLTEVLNAVTFMGFSQTYQYAFQGALILIAAFVYTVARGRRRA